MGFDKTDEIPKELTAQPQTKSGKPPVALYALSAGLFFLIALLALAY